MNQPTAATGSPTEQVPSNTDRPAVAVDVVIFTLLDSDLKVLLVRRGSAPFKGVWAIPGGIIQAHESLEAAALRKMEENAGAKDVFLEQLYTFGDFDRPPRTPLLTLPYLSLARP